MTVVCVVDAHGSQFTQAAATGATGSSAVLIYAATVPTCGNCIPSDRFTVTFSRGTFMDVYAYEVSGVSTVGLATGTGSGSGTIASTSPVSFTAGAFLLGVNIHDFGASVTAGSGFSLNNDVIGISAAEYADPVSSPTTFPAILSGSVNWAEAGIALNPTLGMGIVSITTATTFMPVHQTPVGGVMLPSVGFSVLLPWAIALSLLGVLSVEAFRVKRHAKRR